MTRIPHREETALQPPAHVRLFPVGKGQSRWMSFLEAWANVGVGFTVNYAANLLVLPYELARSGGQVTPWFAFRVGLWFTGISLARSYALRRVFEGVGR